MTLAELLPQLNDKDLATLAYLTQQAEGRQEDQGSSLHRRPSQVAAEIKAAAWRREASRRVTLTNPATGNHPVALTAGPA